MNTSAKRTSRPDGAAVPGKSQSSYGRSQPDTRIYFLDNLRTFMIFLVVLFHAGWVYESSGSGASFWIVDDPATNDLCGLLNLVLDIFVLPTIFFVSGFLAPASLRSKTAWTFVKAKSTRLMLPWAIAVLTLIPLYKVIFLYSRGLPQEHWTTYFHFSNGILSQNWLWFLPVLFLFNMFFLLLSKGPFTFPNVSLKTALVSTFLIGFAYSVGIDMFGLRGWTKIVVLDFQNERLLIYLMAFLIGALCFRNNVFVAKPKRTWLYHIVNAIAWIPITGYIVFLLYPWLHPGSYLVSETIHRLILWFSYQLSLFCLVYLVIETFQRYQNRQGTLRKELSRNSYYVYIIHVIVMGGLALALLDTSVPSLWKYLVVTSATYAASTLIISLVRKVAGIAVFNKRAKGPVLTGQLARSYRP